MTPTCTRTPTQTVAAPITSWRPLTLTLTLTLTLIRLVQVWDDTEKAATKLFEHYVANAPSEPQETQEQEPQEAAAAEEDEADELRQAQPVAESTSTAAGSALTHQTAVVDPISCEARPPSSTTGSAGSATTEWDLAQDSVSPTLRRRGSLEADAELADFYRQIEQEVEQEMEAESHLHGEGLLDHAFGTDSD